MNNPENKSDGQDYLDGEFDSEIAGYKTVEKVDTVIGEDGVEETHITHEVKRASRWTFLPPNAKKFDLIDWSDE